MPNGSAPHRLRVLAVVDDPVVPAALARAVDRLAEAPVASLAVRVSSSVSAAPGPAPMGSWLDRTERALVRPTPDALAPVDLRGVHGERFGLAQDDPEVVVDLTEHGLPTGAAGAPEHGVWSLRFGRDRRRLGGADFRPEYLSGSDVTVCELVAERDAHQHVVYRSVSALDRHSPARTRNEAAWKSAEFPARALSALASGARPRSDDVLVPPVVDPHRHSSQALAGLLFRRAAREAVRRLAAQPSWMVAVRVGASGAASDPTSLSGFDTRGFTPVTAPRGRFYADPFVVAHPGGAYVFVEDGPVAGGAARITVVSLGPSGEQVEPPRAVLERPTHLSYPFVFHDAGEWYLVPETAGTGAVELLRATDFPWRWEPAGELLPGIRAWDPTLLRHRGRYWLFANTAASGARPSDELSLFHAPGLAGPWRPHPMNPIVSDARRARPAGRILSRDGSLYRPAQDASGGYGRRIVLNRICVLTTEDYREAPVGWIEPGWLPGVRRTHTYTRDGDVEALDGLRYARRTWR